MDKKGKNECSKVLSTVKILTVTALMTTGATYKAFGMEWLLGGIGSAVTGVVTRSVSSMSESAVSYLDKEKKSDDLFSEGIANSKREDAEKATIMAFDNFREKLRGLEVYSNAQLAEKVEGHSGVRSYYTAFQTWYTKYRHGFLVLDYTDAFCHLCDSSIKDITRLIPQIDRSIGMDEDKVRSQQAYFEGFISEIKQKKELIGAKLYYTYPYIRGGGPVDRFYKHKQIGHDRYHKWGVYYFKDQSAYNFEEVSNNVLDSNLTQDIIIFAIREAYRSTLQVLSDKSKICTNAPQTSAELLEEYFATFNELYPDRPLSPCHLSEMIFNDEEPKLRLEKTSSTSTVSSPSGVKVPVKPKAVPRSVSQPMSVPTSKGMITPKRTSHDFTISSSLGSSRNSAPKEILARKIVQEEQVEDDVVDNDDGVVYEGDQEEDLEGDVSEGVELTVQSGEVEEKQTNSFPKPVVLPVALPKPVSSTLPKPVSIAVPKASPVVELTKSTTGLPKVTPVAELHKPISNGLPKVTSLVELPNSTSGGLPKPTAIALPKPISVLPMAPSLSSNAGRGSFFADLDDDYQGEDNQGEDHPGEEYQGEDYQDEEKSQEGDDGTHY